MSQNQTKSEAKRFAIAAAAFAVHQVVSTWGIIATTTELTALLVEIARMFGRPFATSYAHWILTETPYFPVQIMLAVIFGALVGFLLNRKSMLWVWIVPFTILCYVLVAIPNLLPSLTTQVPQPVQTRFSHYFGYGCRPQNHCIDQTLITLPFYTSVAYSIGVLLARRIRAAFGISRSTPSRAAITLSLIILVAVIVDIALSIRQGAHWIFVLGTLIPIGVSVFLISAGVKKQGSVASTAEGI